MIPAWMEWIFAVVFWIIAIAVWTIVGIRNDRKRLATLRRMCHEIEAENQKGDV